MPSPARRMARQYRKHQRGGGQPIYKDVSPAGYTVLHPTKGWRRISAKRLRAQHRMAQLLGA